MAIIVLPASQGKINTSVISPARVIKAELKISPLGYKPSLDELFAHSLLSSKTPAESIFRAKEFYDNLQTKFIALNANISLSEFDLQRFNKVLKKLQMVKASGKSFQEVVTPRDAEILTGLIETLEALQEEKDRELKVVNSLDLVMNTICDRIMNILLQEALTRGSYINLALSVARLNPIVDIPDENELRESLKRKVLTPEFKNCLLESVKGSKAGRSNLTPMQKRFFFFANIIVWTITHLPESSIKYVPRISRVTRLSVNLIEQIPLAGPFFNKLFSPIDEAIKIIERHPEEIRVLRRESKQVKLLNKILDAVNKLKNDGINLFQRLFS